MSETIYLEEVDSTNRYAADNFETLQDGTLVAAKRQTAGRGRLGREWVSPEGNVYASFVIKTVFDHAFHATMISSLAVLAALRDLAPEVKAYVKWPNDIFVGAEKLCGVLCEGVARHNGVAGVICGIGVNLNLQRVELMRIDQPATSVLAETGREINVKNFIEKLAIYLNWYYIILINSRERLFAMWKSENSVIGRTVQLIPPEEEDFTAKVLDIGEDGSLLVERDDGRVLNFACGDVKISVEQTD